MSTRLRPKPTPRPTPGRPPKHDREAWVTAATTALREGGIAAVQIEPLARALGATKGSFYWHFADRAALLAALLEWWALETDWLIRAAREAATPRERLLRYFTLVSAHREYPPDAEILSWARRDVDVAREVKQTERARLAFIEEELAATGLAPDEARRRARGLSRHAGVGGAREPRGGVVRPSPRVHGTSLLTRTRRALASASRDVARTNDTPLHTRHSDASRDRYDR